MESGGWKARYVRHRYEQDKLIPVNPSLVPVLDEKALRRFPVRYRYSVYCQEATMDRVRVSTEMPGIGGRGASVCGKKYDELYRPSKD